MGSIVSHSTADRLQNINKRVLLGLTGFAVAAVIGATSLVGAQAADKPTKEWCAAQGFSNYGQCVKQWAHGHGYGGSSVNNINASVSVKNNQSHGNHNVFSSVVNFFFG
jgi:hypothetical protein